MYWGPVVLTLDTKDGHQLRPQSRWGHGQAPHARLQSILEQGREDYERVLTTLETHRDALHAIQFDPDPGKPTAPFWNNIWFTALDAAALLSFLLSLKPRNYLEIGSGHSTMIARHAVRLGALPTLISSIDPFPRAAIDALCDRKIRAPLETCSLALFDELERGDILFFDGSHRVFTNSDVTVFFLEVLPRLKAGLIVHLHDIFLPADYPPAWNSSLFSEQYMLGAMLLCPKPPFRVRFPCQFVCLDTVMGPRVQALLRAKDGGRDIPFAYPNPGATLGSSFWFETTPAQ